MISLRPAALTAVALLGLSFTPSLQADTWNKKTVVTIKEVIQLPHTVLQPGTYVFKLADSQSDRHIVQIFNADESQIIATILAIPNYRLQPTDKSVFRFWETPAGNPKAMRAWFYPGDNFGQEFAYPKMKSLEFAKVTHTAVPALAVEKENEAVDVAVLQTAPVVVVTEQGEEKVLLAQNTVVQTEPEAAPYVRPAALPKTASSLPLLGLAGLVSLGAFGLLVCLPQSRFRIALSRRS